MQCQNKINTLHNIDYDKQQCTNAFIMRSVLHNVNAFTASILSQSAECNARIRLTTLLMIFNNAQMLISRHPYSTMLMLLLYTATEC